MLYINKGQVNNLVLNINNNSTDSFTSYDLVFTHIMSKKQQTYTIYLDDPLQYTSNIRYCTITLDLATTDLIYLGQYQLNVYGDADVNVYVTMAVLQGPEETNPFTSYVSPNEVNENYIYIQD